MSGRRHNIQRRNRVTLKADCVVLLDRLQEWMDGMDISRVGLAHEIAEMRMRLAPKPGVRAPIILTGYTKGPRP